MQSPYGDRDQGKRDQGERSNREIPGPDISLCHRKNAENQEKHLRISYSQPEAQKRSSTYPAAQRESG
jgi:hypothetical protein